MASEPDAIRRLWELENTHGGRFCVKRFKSGERRIFHPKFALFETKGGKRTAILGSSNLTRGGLCDNHEANILIDQHDVISDLLHFFDDHFKGGYARPIDLLWLARYSRVWEERMRAQIKIKSLRTKAIHLQSKREHAKEIPNRISGFTFGFTGRIVDWPRPDKLYPALLRYRGQIAKDVAAIGRADCLVQGEFPEGKNKTRKLQRARDSKVPVISENEFFGIMDREKRLRKR